MLENQNVISSPDSSGIPRFWAWIQRMAGGIVKEKIKRVLQEKETSIELWCIFQKTSRTLHLSISNEIYNLQ